MNKMQEQVLEFHNVFEILAPDKPAIPNPQTKLLRRRLMEEELNELIEAMDAGDMVGIADGIADLLVVTLGTAISYGIDIEPIFDEVHRSNMTKHWPDGKIRHDEFGKVIKSPDYSPADIKNMLEKQNVL